MLRLAERKWYNGQRKKAGEIWKYDIYGNVVEVKEAGGGELVCCQNEMTKVGG